MKLLLLFLGLVVAAVSSSAADRAPLIGVWKLLSYQTELQEGTLKAAIPLDVRRRRARFVRN